VHPDVVTPELSSPPLQSKLLIKITFVTQLFKLNILLLLHFLAFPNNKLEYPETSNLILEPALHH